MNSSHPKPGTFGDAGATGALIALLIGSVVFLFLGPGFANTYAGYGALIAIPLSVGALFTEAWGRYSWLGCLGTPLLLLGGSLGLVALGIEGFACVAMVMPVWIVAALGGGLMALWLAKRERAAERTGEDGGRDPTTLRTVSILALPLVVIFAERAAPPQWEERAVVRTVDIDAPVAVVWPWLASTPHIRPSEGQATLTHDWLRIPRPEAATLVRRGSKLVRLANWQGGIRFEEQIDLLAPRRAIGWRFDFPDDSVQLGTDRHIDPDGPILKIESGQYDLVSLGAGRSRLTLTTRYRMRTRLGWYLGWWGERFLGDIGVNVLAIVRDRAERAKSGHAHDTRVLSLTGRPYPRAG